MPAVDFTKDELISELKGMFSEALMAEREFTRETIREALVAEREVTKEAIREALVAEREVVRQMMTETFLSFWQSNLGPAFDEVHGDFARTRAQMQRAGRELRG